MILDKINIQNIVTLAKKAGEAVITVNAKDFDVEYKVDESPLTEADKAAHHIIEKACSALDQQNGYSL
ncbi:hypothetical protein [Cycloclasticus sp.]|uniref:hypothetical protein n=1 Tax=Cycloclasticus sp. TaxID=2024830 RepID=UPI00257D6445|nr:hypothetical protein [Cycloclasticus sp.]